jgi:hypothetical protein
LGVGAKRARKYWNKNEDFLVVERHAEMCDAKKCMTQKFRCKKSNNKI